jgi:hypothetical protein
MFVELAVREQCLVCRCTADSVGLNGSEGHIYKGSAPGESLTHAFRPDDVVGAGIIPEKDCVFFTYARHPYHTAVDAKPFLINTC